MDGSKCLECEERRLAEPCANCGAKLPGWYNILDEPKDLCPECDEREVSEKIDSAFAAAARARTT